jgi:molybdopterin molybdotransferase
MIDVEDAERIILENVVDFGIEKVPIEASFGRILAENLKADRDFPPFDRVTMDGISINFEAFYAGQKNFKIESISPAGSSQHSLKNTKNCIEVMTGTMLPKNCDTVIRYEDLDIKNGFASIQIDEIKKGQNIHKKGTDRHENDIIIPKGRTIASPEIGVAATIGKSEILVKKMPKVVIISTGDELIPVCEKPLLHQIRTSNGHAIQAALKNWGVSADIVHLRDNENLIEQSIKQFLIDYDVLILSGGVSAGKFDFVPQSLNNQGVTKLFHKISQRPGKPFWFGRASSITNRAGIVFALPGNPVSTFMCLQRYFKVWLDASLGIGNSENLTAELTEDVFFKPDLTYFLQVKIIYQNSQILAKPISGNGSGDLANLADADAFLELPKGRDLFKKGESFRLFVYR